MKTENVLLQEPSMSRSHLMTTIDYAVLRSIEHLLMFVSCDKLDYIFICRFSQGLMKCVPVIKVASNWDVCLLSEVLRFLIHLQL